MSDMVEADARAYEDFERVMWEHDKTSAEARAAWFWRRERFCLWFGVKPVRRRDWWCVCNGRNDAELIEAYVDRWV